MRQTRCRCIALSAVALLVLAACESNTDFTAPSAEQAVYAPALVAFVGGKNFQMSVSVGGSAAPNVGWFPLAPREVYQPVEKTWLGRLVRAKLSWKRTDEVSILRIFNRLLS